MIALRRLYCSCGSVSLVLVALLACATAGWPRSAALAAETPPGKTEAKGGENADKRLPVPPAAALSDSEKQIKEVFKEEFQKKAPADRIELAKRLLKLAQDSRNDGLMYYAALREAKDLAVSGGDVETAFAAIAALEEAYTVDAPDLRVNALSNVGRAAATPEAAEKAFEAGLGVLDQLADGLHFEAATKLISPLEDLARRANSAELAARVQARSKELRAQQTDWAKVKPHFDKLKTAPDDPDANLAVAKHYVTAKSDWEHALPLFAKCSAPVLKEAAAKDALKPEEAAARADLGDLWWSVSEKESGPFKTALQSRAVGCYNQALEGLTGVRKMQVEKRLQAASAAMGTGSEALKAAGLVFWVNPNQDPAGKPRDLISNTPGTNLGAVPVVADSGMKALKFGGASQVTYPATDAVRAIRSACSAFVWIKPEKTSEPYPCALFRGTAPGPQVGKGYADFSLFFHEHRLMLWFNWPENTWPGVDGKTAFLSKHALTLGKWVMCGATWDGSTIAVYVNGERDNTFKSAMLPAKRTGAEIVALGCDPAGTPEYFAGLLHSAMIFNRALTDTEVRQIHLLSGIQGK
ncbi:MAG: hypothetical protein NTW87_21175 [Planctomycetota bacterium]|nr:hypothetical protein [Planctomycetota bacterium]